MMPIVRKLTRYAAYAGHTSRSVRVRSGESGGTRNSRTSNVAAIANTPSLNASSRLVRKRPLCGVDRVGHRADQERSAWLLIAEVGGDGASPRRPAAGVAPAQGSWSVEMGKGRTP